MKATPSQKKAMKKYYLKNRKKLLKYNKDRREQMKLVKEKKVSKTPEYQKKNFKRWYEKNKEYKRAQTRVNYYKDHEKGKARQRHNYYQIMERVSKPENAETLERLPAKKQLDYMLLQRSKKVTTLQKTLAEALKEGAKYKSLYEQLLGRKTRKPGILQRFFN